MFDLPSRSELSRRRSQLLSRIHQKFKTVSETHHIGPLRLDFTRVADPDAVLDQIVRQQDHRERLSGQREEDNELHLPYWAELWDSGLGLAQFLVTNTDKLT